ncbi:MAG: Zn-dependent exopeptidase M28 [Candidatus Riflebacteria bacterium]|nr:Zn-dependent exopeptidase M28 [Candidatus Riflebacteria bacterium]
MHLISRICRILPVGIALAMLSTSVPVLALGGEQKVEFDQFIKNIREEKRLDQIGYLIFAKITPSRTSEDRILAAAGSYFYASDEGYLAHVNYVRLDRMKKSGIETQIIDKKRLDDEQESWYIVWTENSAQEQKVKALFEPLYQNEHTMIIRIRPEDRERLIAARVRFSQIDESLLPTRVPAMPKPCEFRTVDPAIASLLEFVKADEMKADVQTLQDLKSRAVGQPGNVTAVKWLVEQYGKIPNLTVTTPTFQSGANNLQNVLAEQKGTVDPKTIIVVCGHFDSTVSSGNMSYAPGADDNGTGAIGVLTIARALAGKKLPYTVLYAEMNAEEIGLYGSKAVAKTLAGTAGVTIKAVFNMDMLADKDDNEVAVIGNTRSNWLIDAFKDAALAYTGLKSNTLYDSKIWYSDHSSFWNIGASAICTIEGYPDMTPYYHTTNDLVVNIAPSMMQKIVRGNLATLLIMNPLPAKIAAKER